VFLRILATLSGLLGVLAPERVIETTTTAVLAGGFENPETLVPRDWYVRTTRLQSALVAVAGLVGLALGAAENTTSD
jgi:hypothetical protein